MGCGKNKTNATLWPVTAGLQLTCGHFLQYYLLFFLKWKRFFFLKEKTENTSKTQSVLHTSFTIINTRLHDPNYKGVLGT